MKKIINVNRMIFKVLASATLVTLVTVGSSASAAVTDNAIDYYNKYGSETTLIGDSFYIGSRASAGSTSGIRFTVLGMQVKARTNGGAWKSGYRAKQGYNGMVNVDERRTGSYVYGLRKINAKVVLSALGVEQDFYQGTGDTEFQFDAIMTSMNNGKLKGDINADGSYSYGSVAYDYKTIAGMEWWAEVTKQDLKKYYDKRITFKNTSKPVPPKSAVGQVYSNMYVSGNTYNGVQSGKRTLFVTPQTFEHRTYAYDFMPSGYSQDMGKILGGVVWYRGSQAKGAWKSNRDKGSTYLERYHADNSMYVNTNLIPYMAMNYLNGSNYFGTEWVNGSNQPWGGIVSTATVNDGHYFEIWSDIYNKHWIWSQKPSGVSWWTNFSNERYPGVSFERVAADGSAPMISGIPGSGWNKGSVGINISAADGASGSGVSSLNLYRNGAHVASGVTSLSYIESAEGTNNFEVRAVDNLGNERRQSFVINIDKTAPSISGIPSSDWSKNDVSFTIVASDSTSGVASMVLRRSGSQVASGVSSLSYTASVEGINSFEVEVVDRSGNVRVQSFVVKIDKTAPNISGIPSSVVVNKDIDINISASDTASGVANVKLLKGNAVVSTGTTSLNYKHTIEGATSYIVESSDNVGNVSRQNFTINVDKTMPVITIEGLSDIWSRVDKTFSIAASDENSGVKYIEYMLEGAVSRAWTKYTEAVTIVNEGITKVSVRVGDSAGNITPVMSGYIKIDKTNPSAEIDVPKETDDRLIQIGLKDIIDKHSGIKEVKVSDKNDFSSNVVVKSLSGQSGVVEYTIPKGEDINSNYTDRNVYIRLIDNAGNSYDYEKSTFLKPKVPNKPIITHPKDNQLFLITEPVVVDWDYSDSNVDFGPMPQIKAEIMLKNKATGEEIVQEVEQFNTTTFKSIPSGEYTIYVKAYNFKDVFSVSEGMDIRVGVFKQNGNVVTTPIIPARKISYIQVSTEYGLPADTKIYGMIYYDVKSDGSYDKDKKINFNLDSGEMSKLFKLPNSIDRVRVEYSLVNLTSPYNAEVSPILNHIRVYAK